MVVSPDQVACPHTGLVIVLCALKLPACFRLMACGHVATFEGYALCSPWPCGPSKLPGSLDSSKGHTCPLVGFSSREPVGRAEGRETRVRACIGLPGAET